MYYKLRKVLLIAFAVFGIALSFISISAPSHRDKIVVGVITQSQWQDKLKDSIGTFYGINLEYLKNIADVLDYELELKAYPYIEPLLDDIESGNIDGAVGFSKTPERLERFLFSEPFFSSTIAVWYRNSNYKTVSPSSLSWVCVEGSVYCQTLVKQGLNNIYFASTQAEAFETVASGRANALISTYVMINKYLDDNDIVRGAVDVPDWLKEEDVSFITSKDKKFLIDDINKILEWEKTGQNVRSVASKNPYHINDKLLLDYRRSDFSDSSITYSTSEDANPFLFRNHNSNKLEGFLPDFLDLIQARTGLKFEYIKPKNSIGSGLTAFQADLVPVAYLNKTLSSDWLLTKPFMQTNYLAIKANRITSALAKNTKSGILASLKKQGMIHLESWHEDEFARYDDLKNLLTDLKAGEIDVAYLPDDIVHSLLVRDNAEGLHISEKDNLTFSVAFAVSKNNTKLKDILDSIIVTIDAKEIEKLSRAYRNFNLIYGYGDQDVTKMIGVVATVFLVLLAVGYFVLAHLRLKVNLAQVTADNEEKERKWLTEIIQEINSLVFIHGEDNELKMSNCAMFLSGDCKGCQIRASESDVLLVDNPDELNSVLKGNNIAESTPSRDCGLGVSYVYRERKVISAPSSNKRFVLTMLQDIEQQKTREQELIDAQLEAQSAVHAREKFLATMSHELRTPLSAVHGLLDLLDGQLEEESNKGLVSQAIRSLNHLNMLVDEVLDYSKLDAGMLKINPQRTDWLPLVSDVLRSFEAKAESKHLDYRLVIRPFAKRWVMVDAVRLTQILTNLLSNAVKFTAEGEIAVHVAVSESSLVVKVIDTGIGMTESQLDSIFKPFVQADDSITRKYGGTGLGLSIVDRLVKCMRGELVLDSQIDLGTTIKVTLPIEVCEKQETTRFTQTYAPTLPASIRKWCETWQMQLDNLHADVTPFNDEQGTFAGLALHDEPMITAKDAKYPDALFTLFDKEKCTLEDCVDEEEINWKQGTLLVAEDNPINQSVIRMQLQQFGITPVIVSTGQEAWEYLQADSSVCLVLTDFHMPEMDGYDLASRMQLHESLCDLPVIGVTAEDARLASKKIGVSGITDVLYKPYGLTELKAMLLRYYTEQPAEKRSPTWLERFSGAEALEVARVFIDSMKADLEQLKQSNRACETRKIIHGIKGALGAVGVSAIAAMCIRAEQSSDDDFESHVTGLINSIEQEIEHVEFWIEAYEQ
ncbi:MAG: transporter substrate-binding domain-containing protein [Vibrionaceae bacterium]|nr:transporter substrate-binding domain-containing protein [Vibrionaceae bacterium]